MVRKWQQQVLSVPIVIAMGCWMSPSGYTDVPDRNPLLSQSWCLKVLDDALAKVRTSQSISEADRKVILQCQSLLTPALDPNAPVPTVAQCITGMQAIFDGGVNQLLNLNLSENQTQSLGRCKEVVQARYIPSGSMQPTLQLDDRILIDQTAYAKQPPQRRDIILFDPTEALKKQNFNAPFVSRVIGLPGERVEVKQGTVYINNQPLKEPYIQERPEYRFGPALVPSNAYFVLGDNRNNAYDSHYWGYVPRELIIGKAVWRYAPANRVGSLTR